MKPEPMLDCPECGTPLVRPHGRGYYDKDGEYIAHRDGCRCRWCDWMWFDDQPTDDCECGACVTVEVDEQHAYARAVRK